MKIERLSRFKKERLFDEWYYVDKNLKLYSFELLQKKVFEQYKFNFVTKKQIYKIIELHKLKKIKQNKSDLDEYNEIQDRLAFFDENIKNAKEELIDLKIVYLSGLYERENEKQQNIEKKIQGNISLLTFIVAFLGFLGALSSKYILTSSRVYFFVLLILCFLTILFFIIAILYSFLVLKPSEYLRPNVGIIVDHVKESIRQQKIEYLEILYKSISFNMSANAKKAGKAVLSFRYFIFGVCSFLFFIAILILGFLLKYISVFGESGKFIGA